MRLATARQMRELDRAAIGAGTPSLTLMDRAAEGVAQAVLESLPDQPRKCRAAVFCGAGNNGGDGIAAARLVKPGMAVGLGTGSTVRYLVDELGRRHQEEGLDITGVTTSRRTTRQAESYGIRIVDIDDVGRLDLTIDGADQVDANFNGIKGGGAALLWEKIVAVNSDRYVWIVDRSKLCDEIGAFPLPIEIIPFGARHVVSRFRERGYEPVLRTGEDGTPIRTDENNYIVDLHLGHIDHPRELAQDLISTVGVVEHGLFLGMVDEVIVGNPGKPAVLVNPLKR